MTEPTAHGVPRDTSGAARRAVLLRLDPAVHGAIARWAADDLRSVNAQIEMLLRRALSDAGRAPRDFAPPRRRGRPARTEAAEPAGTAAGDPPRADTAESPRADTDRPSQTDTGEPPRPTAGEPTDPPEGPPGG